MLSSIDKLHKRPQYGFNQGGSSRQHHPAKVAAVNGDIQRNNKNGQKNAGLKNNDTPFFVDMAQSLQTDAFAGLE